MQVFLALSQKYFSTGLKQVGTTFPDRADRKQHLPICSCKDIDILKAAQLPRFRFHPRHSDTLKELKLRFPRWRERWPDAFHQLPRVAFFDALVGPAQTVCCATPAKRHPLARYLCAELPAACADYQLPEEVVRHRHEYIELARPNREFRIVYFNDSFAVAPKRRIANFDAPVAHRDKLYAKPFYPERLGWLPEQISRGAWYCARLAYNLDVSALRRMASDAPGYKASAFFAIWRKPADYVRGNGGSVSVWPFDLHKASLIIESLTLMFAINNNR